MHDEITVLGARENNLKNINVSIPWHKYTVITGLSGSGKSSLALDTIYAEGLRRYVECLSTYARQFLERVDRPQMNDITGLPPAVAIESRNQVKNSRSTVGTTTEIYDYLRLLFAKIGNTFCPNCEREVKHSSPQNMAEELLKNNKGQRAIITFPLEGMGEISPAEFLSKGFTRVIIKDEILDLEEVSTLPEDSKIVVDRVVITNDSISRIIDSLEVAFSQNKYVYIHILEGDIHKFSKELECPYCQTKFSEPTPLLFSFNSPQGACPTCRGFGNILQVDPDLVVPNPEKSLIQGAIEPLTKPSLKHEMKQLLQFARTKGIDINTPYKNLGEEAKKLIFEGDGRFPGVKGYFRYMEEKSYKMHVRVFLSKYRSAFTCTSCNGSRLRPEALLIKVGSKKISELTEVAIKELRKFFENLTLSDYEKEISKEIIKQIRSRIDFLIKVGLDYVSLSRLTKTLSGGESQRVNLACQLGSSLTETLYIMDEPSIGLHPRDISRLVSIIKELRDRNNTVVVVEHDSEMIRSSDYIIELGPLAGEKGGEVVYQGSLEKFINQPVVTTEPFDIAQDRLFNGVNNDRSGSTQDKLDTRPNLYKESLTKLYMTQRQGIRIPAKRRKGNGKKLAIVGASENNLKNITVSLPLGTFICVTGVSGSGKSSLIQDVIYSALARRFHTEIERVGKFKEIQGISYLSDVVMLDQTPIGRSSRSNPVTYIKAYDDIRKVMSDTWEARSRRLSPSHFSFNVPGGRCEICEGEGRQKIEMHFLADVYVTCEVCKGKRFKKEVLEVRYKEKNIDEILDLTINEALIFFTGVPPLLRKLKIVQDVGLGYLKLGQPAPSLSGGEAQRIKIARELGRKARPEPGRRNGRDILYILDEPTVGLHTEDIKKLLLVLNKLVYAGNTVIIVEHNLDVIKSADYVIDLGPEGGDEGGYIVAQGTPEEIAKVEESYTGIYLRKVLL
ncbi:MAG: excinuclease ABC subunit UvrA [Deltaproteobacteria bacterium]|nr:excinuclease ABC subunit UvrA [Deltaproteobacteria bacterium]